MQILIVKTSSLGDIIHAFSAVEFIKTKFPDAQIDWVVEKPFAELIQAHPGIRDVLRVDTRNWRKNWLRSATWNQICTFRKTLREVKYDVVFDLQGNTKSALICSQARAKIKVGFGKEAVAEWPNLFFTDIRFTPPKGKNIRADYLFLAQSYFDDFRGLKGGKSLLKLDSKGEEQRSQILGMSLLRATPKVMVCAGSAWRNKQLEKGAMIEFLTLLYKHMGCAYLFIWGTPEEKQLSEELQSKFSNHSVVLERLGLPVLQNVMDKMDLVVAMDSLPLHLAGTTGTKTFGIFGASSALKYKPEGERHASFQGHCPYKRTFEKRCSILRTCPTGPCIRSISGSHLFKVFQESHGATA